jgi:hypothetical protein
MDLVVKCPDGSSNDPSRFLNFVDRDCVPYSIPELSLFAGGCLMWVVAYAIIIRNARLNRSMDMAVVAVCSNFAWEFLWSFAFKTDMGWFLVWTYRAWFFLDIYIFWLTLRHGAAQVSTPALARHFKPAMAAATICFGIVYYFFTAEGHDTRIGANSAYIAQLIISGPCLILLLKRAGLEGFSFHVAWLRGFGTAANTVFMYLHYPADHFVQAMATISFVLDLAFLAAYLNLRTTRTAAVTGRPG